MQVWLNPKLGAWPAFGLGMCVTMIGWVVWGAPYFYLGDTLGTANPSSESAMHTAQMMPYLGAFLTSGGGGIATPAFNWIISTRALQVDQAKAYGAVGFLGNVGSAMASSLYFFFLYDAKATGFAVSKFCFVSAALYVLCVVTVMVTAWASPRLKFTQDLAAMFEREKQAQP